MATNPKHFKQTFNYTLSRRWLTKWSWLTWTAPFCCGSVDNRRQKHHLFRHL